MKHCVKYPDDKFLAVRPCLVAICFGNRPAAKLLGALLYRYNLRVENKDDAENQNAIKAANGEQPDQDTTYRIFRRQAQLVEDMCGEMTEKTLHDVAVPMLQVLGYLDLEEYMQSNCYIVNIDQVQQALDLYSPTTKEQTRLEKVLITHMQLEKFLITSDELEVFLIDKKNFLSGLEKVLIWNRNTSNCKRGRKGNGQAPSKGKKRRLQNLKEDSKKDNEEETTYTAGESPTNDSTSALATVTHTPSQSQGEFDETTTSHPGATPGVAAEQLPLAAGVCHPTATPTEHASRAQQQPSQVADSPDRDRTGYQSDGRDGYTNSLQPDGSVYSAGDELTAAAQATKRDENETQSQFSTGGVDKSARQRAKVEPATQPEQQNEMAPTKPASARKSRQPKAPRVDPAEIERYLALFDTLFQEVTGNPDEGYLCSGEDRKELTALLEANLKKPRYVTPEKLRVVYMRLWNKPKDEHSGFHWQEHMKIKNVCKQYPQEAMTLSAQANAKKQVPNATTISGMKRWVPPGNTVTGASSPAGGH